MAKYKLIKAYDAGGDLSKEWFVKYHYLKPRHLWKSNKPEYERFRVTKTINSYHTVKERRERLRIVMAGLKILLDEYKFDPYAEFRYSDRVETEGYSIGTCRQMYFDSIDANLSKDTVIKYKERVNLFYAWLEKHGRQHIMIFDINRTDISNFLTETHRAHPEWSNKNYNHLLTDIRTFFNHFKKNYSGYVSENPADYIKKLRVVKKGNRPFKNEELKNILDYTAEHDPKLNTFMKFLYYSCCRPDSEARFMKREYFDLEKRTMCVPGELSKNDETFFVPIDDEFFDFLKNTIHIESIPNDHYLFGTGYEPGPAPIYKKAFSRKFLKVKRALKLHRESTIYSCKHTRACHLVEDEVPLYRVQTITRHKTLSALMDYLKDMNVIIDKQISIKSRKL